MTKNIFFLLCLSAQLFAHVSIFDGGGVSSGADLIKDGINPWWLQNTKEVKYCLEVEPGFSVTQVKLQSIVEKAFSYWKIQFKVQEELPSQSTPLIATQNFVLNCENADLHFKFGLGTILPDEKTYLPEPDKTVGLAVRSSYDKVNLRGKGFIYLASDKASKRGLGVVNGVENPWKYDGLVFWMLVHELGHVFGIPHIASFPTSGIAGLMSHNFADILLSKDFFEKYVLIPEKITSEFWTGGERWQNCGLKDDAWKWLEGSGVCVLTQAVSKDTFQLFTRTSLGVPAFLGEITNIKTEARRLEPTVMVQLTEEQNLFPVFKVPFLAAIGFYRTDYSGIFKIGGKSKPVHFEVSDKGLKLHGVEKEKILLILNP